MSKLMRCHKLTDEHDRIYQAPARVERRRTMDVDTAIDYLKDCGYRISFLTLDSRGMSLWWVRDVRTGETSTMTSSELLDAEEKIRAASKSVCPTGHRSDSLCDLCRMVPDQD